MTNLDPDEQELLDAHHEGRLEQVPLSADDIATYREAAREASRKSERINIRITAQDLEDLKVKALETGMPYQTLITSILHQYASGRLVLKT
ncbi:MAG: antitoxin [Acidobacteriota bacterium]